MDITSRSFNYATRKYELWGATDSGHAAFIEEPTEYQLELELPETVPKHPPKQPDLESDACQCASCR